MKALLLIDIQNDFLPGGSLAVHGGDEIIPVCNKLQEHFDLVVASQDWHPCGHQSFASSHPGSHPFDIIELNNFSQVLWPDHCIQGTDGAAISRDLSTNRVEAIFRKGTNPEIDSYSAFYDNNYLRSTGLADYFRGKGVRHVYIAGLAADYCVYYSAKDSIGEGFDTLIIEDATRPINAEAFTTAKEDIKRRGGKIIQSSSLLK
ncbi:bifunctional nicotinamidase/pyrazinamidase [Rubrolithibacter danxiaensis]|uniref:bifunctional nicotinamidase/pyrazinamidase n=1 Tax=Rubrolithibacter danxiaensis TaxID=3390805 RepID=UPI003BF80319